MTTFVYCRGCGQQIHSTAPTCPHCGAPQMIAPAAGNASGTLTSGASGAVEYTSYDQVPWYRGMWVFGLSVIFFPPVWWVLAYTGRGIYFKRQGQPKKLTGKTRTILLVLSVAATLFQLARSGSH